MMKFSNVLLAAALGAGSLLGAAAPASAAHIGTVRPGTTTRVVHTRYTTVYRGGGYRYGYGYPYSYGYPYGVGVGFGVGYGYGVSPGYAYAPYPAVYAPRPYWRPHHRVVRVRRVVRY